MRGIVAFVLNQKTGALMATRAFDTYASKEEGEEIAKFIEILQDGRIVCLAVKVRIFQTHHKKLKKTLKTYILYSLKILAVILAVIFQGYHH